MERRHQAFRHTHGHARGSYGQCGRFHSTDFRRYDIAGDQGAAIGGKLQRPLQLHRSRFLRACLPRPGWRGRNRAERQPCRPVRCPRLRSDHGRPERAGAAAGGIRAPGEKERARRHCRSRQYGRQGHAAAKPPAADVGPVWQGGGEVLALNVRSPLTNTRFALDKIPFAVSSDGRPGAEPRAPQSSRRGQVQGPSLMWTLARSIWPWAGPPPLRCAASFRVQATTFRLQGDAEVQRLLEVARTLGLPAPSDRGQLAKLASISRLAEAGPDLRPLQLLGPPLHSVTRPVRGLNDPAGNLFRNISDTQKRRKFGS